MTLLIATAATAMGMITQDTCVSSEAGAAPKGWTGLRALAADEPIPCFGDGMAPDDKVVALANKIGVFPHLRMIAGVIGALRPALDWYAMLGGLCCFADIDDVDATGVPLLEEIVRRAGCPEFGVAHIGFSLAADRIVGKWYAFDGGTLSVQSFTDNHVVAPAPDTAISGYREAYELGLAAQRGAAVHDFQDGMAGAIVESYAAGFYRRGIAIGGQLVSASIDRSGIAIGVRRDLPDLQRRRREAVAGIHAVVAEECRHLVAAEARPIPIVAVAEPVPTSPKDHN